MSWVRVEDSFPRNPKVRPLSDAAFRLHVSALCFCAENLTDGLINETDLPGIWLWGGRGRPKVQLLVAELVSHGLWDEDGSQEAVEKAVKQQPNSSQIAVKKAVKWWVHDYTKYNTKKEQVVTTREKEAARQKAWRESKKAPRNAVTNTVTEEPRNGVSNGTPYHSIPYHVTTTTSPKPAASDAGRVRAKLAEAGRADVERVCEHLRNRIIANGATRKPGINERWREAARLMLDKDKLTEEQIHAAIDWCQDDEFWRANILSMSKLREKYEQLRLAAMKKGRKPASRFEKVQATMDLVRKYEEAGE